MFQLPEQLREEILNYLVSRPFIEVNKIIQSLARLEKVNNKPMEKDLISKAAKVEK